MSTSDEQLATASKRIPAFAAVKALVECVLPGSAPAMAKLRSTIYAFCANPLSSCFHLAGDIGAGKSTTARVISMAKRLAPLKQARAHQIVNDLRYERPGLIDLRMMPWYVELALTGLAESTAEAQLFGVASKAFTNVKEHQGVFEVASGARGVVEAANATGGAVFLDEIADLPLHLQAKLLPVLSGGAFYRVGAEDKPLTYQGITITASWRPLNEKTIRPDLLSRISDYVVAVPNLEERLEDFDALVRGIHGYLVRQLSERIEGIVRGEPAADREGLASLVNGIETLDSKLIDTLRAVPWRSHGNMRGLVRAMERILIGREEAGHVVAELRTSTATLPSSGPEELYRALLARSPGPGGLAKHIKDIQKNDSLALRDFLSNDPGRVERLGRTLGIEPEQLREQIRRLGRDRSRRENDDD